MKPLPRSYFENLVYRSLYPAPDSRDPHSFDDFVRKFLIKEVRLENVRYYGREADRGEQQDALYPGHDYFSTASRTRLGQYPSHRRLFDIFDDLRLTSHDIDLLCTWEGTKSAKERYEEEKGFKVKDPCWDYLPPPPRRTAPTVYHHGPPKRPKVKGRFPVTPKPAKRDYYGDSNIWGNFNVSPTTPPRMPRYPRSRNDRPYYPYGFDFDCYEGPLDPYHEWLSIMQRAGTLGVHGPPTPTWTPGDILGHNEHRHRGAYRQIPITPAARLLYDNRRQVESPTNAHLYTARVLPTRSSPANEFNFAEAAQGYDAPIPLAVYRYHTQVANATSEALARTEDW